MSESGKVKNIQIKTRRFTVKKNEGYGVPSKGLIRSWRVTEPNFKFVPILIVDDYKVRGVPRKNLLKIDIEEIRSFIRNPERENDSFNLDNFESIACINQLYAIEFYKSLSDREFFSCLFTRDYKSIGISFGENGPDEVEIEEEYWDRNETQEPEKKDEAKNEIKSE